MVFLDLYIPYLLLYWFFVFLLEKLFVFLVSSKITSGMIKYYLFQYYQVFGVGIPVIILINPVEEIYFMWDLVIFGVGQSYWLIWKLKIFNKEER